MELKKSLTTKTIVLLLVALVSPSISAAIKVVKCTVENNTSLAFHGNCFFTREKGGSFSLKNADNAKTILEDITDVSVDIIEKDIAEVRGLTIDGINSRWGEAERSTSDKACWIGADFKICAW